MLYQGSCHCGKIAFEVEGDFTGGMECNCSFCRRRGGILAFVPRDRLAVTAATEALSTYTFNQHRLEHHFCSTCGAGPFSEGKGPDGSAMAAINLRCIPAIDLGSLEITQYDGASR